MTDPRLLCAVADGVMTLTLNRPDKLNAIDNPLAQALLQALRAAAADPAVRVLVLQGAGRAFCAGRDVSAAPTEDDLVLVQAVSQAIVQQPQPVVAAVHGWTVGAGLEWMLDADIAVAADSARFKLPEASLGVFVTGGLSATLPASAGLARAKALMLLGEAFTAAEAQSWGLVWQVVPAEQLAAQAHTVAARLAALQPGVAGRFKKVLHQIGLASFAQAIALESEAQRAMSAARPPEAERRD
ncbi:enoyl-CoA hydratase/isomerase family protein [Ideonella sp. 4Y11]|uniref:Enoyl-CoA hydratase/isomerase family protein n=1 Tax=Ideonella aquatica TaxID=2824119 RepID=A0A940YMZ6_9BURK|nr:enoyl-CoA hydratase-related protein [Ideonella aquatica]MBQ0959326.1 enoyl-CoA hydratase/isomerase family protein [Ideonella aquatica]